MKKGLSFVLAVLLCAGILLTVGARPGGEHSAIQAEQEVTE